jgi:adenosylcobyric acid synthase
LPRPEHRVPALMLQGTGSDVGKSLLTAGLCRVFARRGLAVRPFKPQNMSNNAAVTPDGGEIGRAQALQARAAKVPASVDMNPILLKPQSDIGSQVIVRGKIYANASARKYQTMKKELMPVVLESFAKLSTEADLILVEGAGSAAEVNLRADDIANMGFALSAGVPVMLVGDIDRGGVLAQLVGTHILLTPPERALLRGYLINKFRGDVSLFETATAIIAGHTGMPCHGIIPYFPEARLLPAEDAMGLEKERPKALRAKVKVAVPRLSRIANFDDFDPLMADPEISLVFVEPGKALPGDADLIILPGSKSTIADLETLRREGWDYDIRAHVNRGGRVLGICAGFQMLGKMVRDPEGMEGPPGETPGLGLLDVETEISGVKTLTEATGVDLATSEKVKGYEMHCGVTTGPGLAHPMLDLGGRMDGARSFDGKIAGCYLHGIFAADGFRRTYIGSGSIVYEASIEATLDALADHLEKYVRIERLFEIAKSRVKG